MSSKTKQRLFIALAGLLASSTAAVLVGYSGTSVSAPHTASAATALDAACLASIEGGCEFDPLAWDEASFVFDFGGGTPLATYPALSNAIGATQGESAQWRFGDEFDTSEDGFSFEDRHLISDMTAQLGGNIGLQNQVQPGAPGVTSSLRNFNSLRLFAGAGAGASERGSPGTGAQDPGSGSPEGSAPGDSSPGDNAPGGNSPDGSSPGDNAPGGSSPGDGAPGSNAPDGNAPGGTTPGGDIPGGENPGSENPGGTTPGGDNPGGGTPGGGSPIGGGPDVPVSVPEPGTLGLLAFGLALVRFMGRRRRAPI